MKTSQHYVPLARYTRKAICVAVATLACAMPLADLLPSHAQSLEPVRPTLGEVPIAPTADAGQRVATLAIVAPNAASVDIQSRAQVSALFHTMYEPTSEVELTWTGNQASCTAGSSNQAYRDALIQRINYFRNMAGVPAGVVLDDVMNAKAEQAALMMSANGQLSHSPPTSWQCYTPDGAAAAGKSNLALGYYGVSVIDGYMQDPGNGNGPVGHRRWLLYPQTQQMGAGDVTGGGSYRPTNALWIIDSHYSNLRPATRDVYVAWPPPGYVPYPVVYPRWSFSYPRADFSAATVSLTRNGQTVDVTKETVANGYGENTLVWAINGMGSYDQWPLPAQDTPYEVHISNVNIGGQMQEFTYTVIVFDPSNTAPTSVAVVQAPLSETMTSGDVIGTIVVTDPDAGDSATVTLVAGEGDTDNDRFSIVGDALVLNTTLNAPIKAFYYVRLQAVDSAGNAYTQSLVIIGQPLQIFLPNAQS